jgi:hypothetical protein
MSELEDACELPPSPLEIVEKLDEAHTQLIRNALFAYAAPSDETLRAVKESVIALKWMSAPVFDERFFIESENDMLISVAVGAVVNSGDDLYERSRVLFPESDELVRFPDGARETLVHSFFTGDVSAFVTPETSVDTKEEVEAINADVVILVNNTYSTIIDKFEHSLLNSNTVSNYLDQRIIELEKQLERIQQIKTFGIVAVGAFVGTWLANQARK